MLFHFVSFRFFFHCFSLLSHWFHRFVRLCFIFSSLFIAMNVILFWFSILFIYVISTNIPNCDLQFWREKTVSLSLFLLNLHCLLISLSTHTQKEKHANIHIHMHMYSSPSPSPYISNVELHLYVCSYIPPFPSLFVQCVASFSISLPMSLYDKRVSFSFLTYFFVLFDFLKRSQYNLHSIHSYTLNMYAQIERKSLLFWQQGTQTHTHTHSCQNIWNSHLWLFAQ